LSKLIKASEFCDTIFDGTHETPKKNDKGYPLVTSTNIINNYLDLESTYNISEKDYFLINKRSKVSKWDILFSMIGSVGETLLEKNDNISYAIKNIGVFSCKDEYKAKWLFYYLNTKIIQKHIKNNLDGAVQKFLPLESLRNFPILDYDIKYKNIIDLLSKIDEQISFNINLNKEITNNISIFFNYWFRQFEFPNQNNKPYKSNGGDFIWNDEFRVNIPKEWKFETIENILKKNTKSQKIQQTYYSDTGKIPIIDQGLKFINGYTNDQKYLIKVNEPQIIFGDHTRSLKYVTFDYARGADGTKIMISKDKSMPQSLLFSNLQDIDLSGYGYARHYKYLVGKPILIPSLRISKMFDDIVSKKLILFNLNIIENEKLLNLRNWLANLMIEKKIN